MRMGLRFCGVTGITLKVANMGVSVRFYRDVLGMDLVYGGKDAYFLFASHSGRRVSKSRSRTESCRDSLGTDDLLCG